MPTSLAHLAVESLRLPSGRWHAWLTGRSIEDRALLREAESRATLLVERLPRILQDALPRLRKLLRDYSLDPPGVPPHELLEGLRLLSLGLGPGDDAAQLRLHGNRHYDSLDLFINVDLEGRVTDVWFDG